MLKTGIKSFVYSFSVSLFAIVSANRAFFYEKNENPSELDIQNKSIALYLAETKPSYVPVKKIALNSLPEIQKQQVQTPPLSEPEIIVASNLENIDIPLEFVEDMAEIVPDKTITPKQQEIVLADVLYAPDKPLEMPEITAEPIYQPEQNIEVKIASAPVYNPAAEVDIKAPPPPKAQKSETTNQKTITEDNSLLIARSETIGKIPLVQTRSNNGVNKVELGNPDDLQHVAFANNSAPIQSMSTEKAEKKAETNTNDKQWKQMNDSPWVVAKSSGSKNLFANKNLANKSSKEIAELIPLEKDKKGVLVASETAKNLIIPIPEDILNKEDITPQLAYPVTSEDKKKEIDINTKIKEAEEKKKSAEANKSNEPEKVLTPIEEEIVIAVDTPPPPPVEDDKKVQKQTPPSPPQKDSIISTLSSIFNKTAQSVSQVTDKVFEKAKEQKTRFGKKKNKNKPVTIMPAEIRLAFQPNRAEISGQTLRWIQAFATKAAQTTGMMLEIRIDGTSSTKLQQNRLNLLYNILTNKGVDYSMINTVFTSRDPNSFILRTIAPKTDNNQKGVNNQKADRYIQW